jgi:molybdopterin-binding protein
MRSPTVSKPSQDLVTRGCLAIANLAPRFATIVAAHTKATTRSDVSSRSSAHTPRCKNTVSRESLGLKIGDAVSAVVKSTEGMVLK